MLGIISKVSHDKIYSPLLDAGKEHVHEKYSYLKF